MHTHARTHTHAHTCARAHTNRWGSLIFYTHTHTLTHTPPPNSPLPNTQTGGDHRYSNVVHAAQEAGANVEVSYRFRV